MQIANLKTKIAIIGGGVTGLSAAYKLKELSASRKLDLECLVLEASNRAGGMINTRRSENYVLELGADSFTTHKPWAADLAKRLGLSVQPTNRSHRRTFIASGDAVHPLPDDFRIIAPSNIPAFLASPLLSFSGKMRLLMDLAIPAKTGHDDETVADFVRRRLGREAFEKIAQPMIGGLYTADPEKLSARSAVPQLREMEELHGSLIRAARAELRAERANRTVATESGARYGNFVSFQGGLQALTDSLISNLPGGWLRLNHPVSTITRSGHGFQVITPHLDEPLNVDAVICAASAIHAGPIFSQLDPPLAYELAGVEHAPLIIMNLVYRAEQMPHKLEGFGFVVPASENRAIMACTFSSVKFNERVPDNQVALRVFLGGALQRELCDLNDAVIEQLVACDLKNLLNIRSKPLLSLITRYPDAMPQYHVGHGERVRRIEARVEALPGVELAGNAYCGVGIPDCIHSGQIAAQRIFDHLLHRSSTLLPASPTAAVY